jgi:hypothetical protein
MARLDDSMVPSTASNGGARDNQWARARGDAKLS